MPAVTPRPRRGEPAWTIAELYPLQGHWEEGEYLDLRTNRLVEFDNGVIEVLPMPTTSHQLILLYLFEAMKAYVIERDLGLLLFAPIKVRLWPGRYREPDILFMAKGHADRIREEYWLGADLVVEVVSPDAASRKRDLREKRHDYARQSPGVLDRRPQGTASHGVAFAGRQIRRARPVPAGRHGDLGPLAGV